MSTIKETLINKLIEHGLWKDEAEKIMLEVESAPENELMKNRWQEDASNYPEIITNIVWFSTKRHAIEWIDANKPLHFAKHILSS